MKSQSIPSALASAGSPVSSASSSACNASCSSCEISSSSATEGCAVPFPALSDLALRPVPASPRSLDSETPVVLSVLVGVGSTLAPPTSTGDSLAPDSAVDSAVVPVLLGALAFLASSVLSVGCLVFPPPSPNNSPCTCTKGDICNTFLMFVRTSGFVFGFAASLRSASLT